MWNYVISNNTHTLIWRGKVTWDVRSTLEKVVNHLSYGLRFKSFSPNLQCGIAKRTQGNVVYCLTAKKKKQTKRKNEKKYRNIHIYTYFSQTVQPHFTIYVVVRECISYRVTTVSLTKHVQRNICHLSNPIHSLCDWTCYNWIITNNPSLIFVDCIFGGGVGFCSTSDAEGLVQSDKVVAGVSLQQRVKRTIV